MEQKHSQLDWLEKNIAQRIIHRKDALLDLEKQMLLLRGEIAGLEWALRDIELGKTQ